MNPLAVILVKLFKIEGANFGKCATMRWYFWILASVNLKQVGLVQIILCSS